MRKHDPVVHRKECKSHYERNKSWYLARNKRLRIVRAQWIRDYKEALGCQNCGGKFPYPALDFHHRDPSCKLFLVSKLINFGWARLKAEVAKCEVLCANCHRLETHFALSSNRQDSGF